MWHQITKNLHCITSGVSIKPGYRRSTAGRNTSYRRLFKPWAGSRVWISPRDHLQYYAIGPPLRKKLLEALSKITDSLWRRANARNVIISFRNSLRWLIYIIKSVDKTNFSCYTPSPNLLPLHWICVDHSFVSIETLLLSSKLLQIKSLRRFL